MKLQTWCKSEVDYGEELFRSAIDGARSARAKAEPVRSVLERSVRSSLPSAATGAVIGLFASYWGTKRTRNVALFGLLGAAIGFATTMAVNTRQLTGETLCGALKNVNTVRDAHWLAKHPIDYA